VEPSELIDRAVAAACGAVAAGLCDDQATLRLDVTDRMKKHGRRIDAIATKIRTSPTAAETIRDCVAGTLRK